LTINLNHITDFRKIICSVAKRLRKNYNKRIKSKTVEISSTTGLDVGSISAIKVAFSMRKRKSKGELLNNSLESTSMNQLYSRIPQLKRPKTVDNTEKISQVLKDIEGIEEEG
jgi:hypothetical protein